MWSGIMRTPNYLLHLLKKSQTSVFHVTYQQSLCWEIKAEAAFFIFMPRFTITPSCPSDPLPSITVVFQGGQWERLDLEHHSNSNHTLGLIISGKSLCTMCYSGDQSSCVFTIPKHSVIWLIIWAALLRQVFWDLRTKANANTTERRLGPHTWRYSILQHLNDTLVACGYAVVCSFVSEAVDQLCVGPTSQQSLHSLNAVTLTGQHQRRPVTPHNI